MPKLAADMNSLKITETFTNVEKYAPIARGTIVISGKEVQVRVYADTLYAEGYVGRYHTSANPWLATVSIDRREGEFFGRIHAHFGRDDRAGRFHKEAGISYEPETYARELAKVRAENEADAARRAAKKALKKASKTIKAAKEVLKVETSKAGYTYEEGMTAAQKKAYRAKMRRQAKA